MLGLIFVAFYIFVSTLCLLGSNLYWIYDDKSSFIIYQLPISLQLAAVNSTGLIRVPSSPNAFVYMLLMITASVICYILGFMLSFIARSIKNIAVRSFDMVFPFSTMRHGSAEEERQSGRS